MLLFGHFWGGPGPPPPLRPPLAGEAPYDPPRHPPRPPKTWKKEGPGGGGSASKLDSNVMIFKT